MSDARTDREVGRYDRKSGRLTVVGDQARVYEVVQALWAFLSAVAGDGATPSVDEPRQTEQAQTPDAECRVVELHAVASTRAAEAPETEERVRGSAAPARDSARESPSAAKIQTGGGKAGRVVDRRLGLLRRDGWAVLSSVGRQTGADIDRLVVGPPGVFAITVRRGDELPGYLKGGLHDSRHDAEFASRMLTEGSGLRVEVRAIVAFVGPAESGADCAAGARATTDAGAGAGTGARHVLVARAEEIVEVLRDLPSVYSLDERHRIVDAARGASSWGPIAA